MSILFLPSIRREIFACVAKGQLIKLAVLIPARFSLRYKNLDGQPLPGMRPWVEKNLAVDLKQQTCLNVDPHSLKLPMPVSNPAFHAFLRYQAISFSNAPFLRLVRSHGQTLSEIVGLRSGEVGRIPDLVSLAFESNFYFLFSTNFQVVWPRTEEQIQKVCVLFQIKIIEQSKFLLTRL